LIIGEHLGLAVARYWVTTCDNPKQPQEHAARTKGRVKKKKLPRWFGGPGVLEPWDTPKESNSWLG
jgi:hypothetical protein